MPPWGVRVKHEKPLRRVLDAVEGAPCRSGQVGLQRARCESGSRGVGVLPQRRVGCCWAAFTAAGGACCRREGGSARPEGMCVGLQPCAGWQAAHQQGRLRPDGGLHGGLRTVLRQRGRMRRVVGRDGAAAWMP